MNKFIRYFSVFSFVLLLASCGHDSVYSGFTKMENGAYLKFYSKEDSGSRPRLKDEVTVHMVQYFNDSVLLNTSNEEPIKIVLKEGEFVGDVPDGILMMHVGDSARLLILADSVIKIVTDEAVPEQFAGKPIYYDIKLLSVKPYEVIELERKARLDSLRCVEQEFLSPFIQDPKNSLTESGLIVLEQTGKGKKARLGDYVEFDFMVYGPQGDTIMNSFGIEPVEIQYGEEFVCQGLTEAVGMVPEGGLLRFVMPSDLAFDSIGNEPFIAPYSPLTVVMKMNSVMDQALYEKKLAAEEAKREAEKASMLAVESKSIADYIDANGITVTPTETGLYFLNREDVEGNLAQFGDEVAVHYEMRNLKGVTLESSYEYGEPMVFKLGHGEMISAIEEALLTMAPGSKVTVLTPSELAFGEFDLGESIPPFTPLVIVIELVSIEQ